MDIEILTPINAYRFICFDDLLNYFKNLSGYLLDEKKEQKRFEIPDSFNTDENNIDKVLDFLYNTEQLLLNCEKRYMIRGWLEDEYFILREVLKEIIQNLFSLKFRYTIKDKDLKIYASNIKERIIRECNKTIKKFNNSIKTEKTKNIEFKKKLNPPLMDLVCDF